MNMGKAALCDMEGTIRELAKTGMDVEVVDVNLDTGEEKVACRARAPRTYTNEQMRQMMDALSEVRDAQGRSALDHGGKVGYAAYRNTRILRECCREYVERAQRLADEYGQPEIIDGNPTGRVIVPYDDPRFGEFDGKMREWGDIEHAPELYLIPASEAIGTLTGTQMLALDWMFEE